MVKHIILWNLKDEFTEEQKADIRAGINQSRDLSGKSLKTFLDTCTTQPSRVQRL